MYITQDGLGLPVQNSCSKTQWLVGDWDGNGMIDPTGFPSEKNCPAVFLKALEPNNQ